MSSLAWLNALIESEHLPADFSQTVEQIYRPLSVDLARTARSHGPGFVLGLCGAQGSGKSTVALALQGLLRDQALSVVVLSLDDLYLGRAERERLATTVHPLFKTRGPPGTHDVALGLSVIDALSRPGQISPPRFDKARDELHAGEDWPRVLGPVDVILFEGWCVGAKPQPPEALETPINALERDQDPTGIWRRHVNAALADDYQPLFSRLNFLILLAAPSFDVVARWRAQQEDKLRTRLKAAGKTLERTMKPSEIAVFVQHYERLTRYSLDEMVHRANVVIHLDPRRRPVVSS